MRQFSITIHHHHHHLHPHSSARPKLNLSHIVVSFRISFYSLGLMKEEKQILRAAHRANWKRGSSRRRVSRTIVSSVKWLVSMSTSPMRNPRSLIWTRRRKRRRRRKRERMLDTRTRWRKVRFSLVWIIRSNCLALRSPANFFFFSWPSRTGAREGEREKEKRLEPMWTIDPETDWSQACRMQAVVCRSPVTSWRRSSIDLAGRSVNKIIPAVQDLPTTTTTRRRSKKRLCVIPWRIEK